MLQAKQLLRIGDDPLTVRELRECCESRAFKSLLARIDLMIVGELLTCETEDSIDVVRRAQGAVKALRRVKSLPQILEQELEQKAQHG